MHTNSGNATFGTSSGNTTIEGDSIHLDGDKITMNNANYGINLPTTGTEGQVFFRIVS
jgi:hypothetical protein